MDALVDARDELVASLLTEAPSSYAVRIMVLLALYGLLFIQSTVFLVLWYRECHRGGKSMKIIQIQKTAQGSMITVQALCAYAFFQVIIGVLSSVRQGLIYIGYFQGGDRTMATLLYFPVLTGACFSALAFTFSHLNAAILLFGNESQSKVAKRAWVPLYNAAFVTLPLVWMGIIVAQGVKSTSAERRSYDAGKEVLPLLNTVIAEPFRMTPTMLVRMQSLQAILTYNAPIFIAYRKGICLLGMVYCIILFIMCIIGLWVIHILRRSVRDSSRILYASHQFDCSLSTGQGGGGGGQQRISPHHTALPGRGLAPSRAASLPSKVSPTRKISTRIGDDGDTLRRLLRNLQSSVPLVLVLCTYFPIALGILYYKGATPGWMWEEFRNDIFTWPWAFINNIIIASFLYNSVRKPSRNVSTGIISVTPAEDEITMETERERGVAKLAAEESAMLRLQFKCAYPPPTFIKEDTTVISEKAQQERISSEGHLTTDYRWK